ncbi:MAG: hypothetical protein ABI460_05905 [Caldimonas sp.]
MAKVAFKPGDLNADVIKAAGPLEVMTYPKGMKFSIEVELPKEIESDKLLAQELWLGVGVVYKDLVARIAENLKNTDRGAVMLRNAKEVEKLKKLIDVVNRGIEGAIGIAQDAAVKSVQTNFDKLKAKRKDYTKYKIKIVVTITGAAVGLATSIALIAATGFSGGASGVIGIISMTKSVAVIATEVISAAQSVEQSIATLKVQIATINKIWGDAKAKGKAVRGAANEVLAAVFKEFLGLPLASAKQCESNAKTALDKLGGLEVNTHDMAKKVTKLMLESSNMQKDFVEKANVKLKKHPDPQALQKYGPKLIGNLQKAVKPGNDAIRALMLEIDRNLKRLDSNKAEMGRLSKELNEIYKIRNSSKFTENAYKILDNSLSVVNNVLMGALSGNGLVEGAKNIAANVVPVTALFAYDKISAVVFADGDLKKALW